MHPCRMPAGACTYAGGKGERQPSELELDYARYQVGQRHDAVCSAPGCDTSCVRSLAKVCILAVSCSICV